MGRACEGRVQYIRNCNVIDKVCGSAQQAVVFSPTQARSDQATYYSRLPPG